MKKKLTYLAIATLMLFPVACEKEKPVRDVIDFEELFVGAEGYWNGSDGTGAFSTGNATFPNIYNPDYESWVGFAYSNHTDNTTPGYDNQYSSITGTGADQSSVYAVYYYMGASDTIKFDVPEKITKISVSNSTNAYLSMLNGDPFARKFGGESGSDPDWFKVVLTGLDVDNEPVGSVEIFLADFRYDNNALDYISNAWTDIDLSPLGYVQSIVIEMASSDMGLYGINTPAYVCIDNIEGLLLPVE